jgi:sterol O-acyltransferase
MFSRDAITLAWSDALLVLTTGICVPFAIALKNNWIQYYWTGIVLQHFVQASILASAITWAFNRQWPWVQSGFLTLHSLVRHNSLHVSPRSLHSFAITVGYDHEDALLYDSQRPDAEYPPCR